MKSVLTQAKGSKKQVFLILLASLAFSRVFAQPQSLLWTTPSQYYSFTNQNVASLPAPGGTDYAGAASIFANNAMHDPNGNLLFFIVDENVYDRNGLLIGPIMYGSDGETVTGTTEWTIIPVPGHCTQYYLVGGVYTTLGSPSANGGFPQPYYIILDLSLPNYNPFGNTAAQGDFIGDDGTNTAAPHNNWAFHLDAPPFTNSTGQYSNATSYIAWELTTHYAGSIHFAATPLRNDGTRFLYVNYLYGGSIARFHVTSTGITFDNFHYLTIDASASSATRAEMELVQLSNGNYRMAVPYGQSAGGMTVMSVMEIDYTSGDITSRKVINLPATSNAHGLEFSQDGAYLYVTHSLSPYLQYADVTVASPAFSPLASLSNLSSALTSPQDYQYSQMEMGNDGKLYFAGASSLAALDIQFSLPPSNSSVTWDDNAVTGISVPISTARFDIFGYLGPDNYKVRLLNDQVDGEIYQELYNSSAASGCCVSNTVFTANTYTAGTAPFTSTTQTWTPTNNPFGGSASTPVANVIIRDKLIIPAGYTITISGMTFRYAPRVYTPAPAAGASVIVERGSGNTRGGRLILTKTTFTSYQGCGPGMWEGIEVQGDKNQSQIPANTTIQGWLSIQNNSVIENAYYGVLTAKRTTPFPNLNFDANYSGGVVIADNSTFRNNESAVYFLFYTDPSNVLHNYSNFDKCQFLTSIMPLSDQNSNFRNFVTMFGTNGITFRGNNFENSRTVSTVADIPANGTGIFGFGAGFQVLPLCLNVNCTGYARNTFKNLGYGIQDWLSSGINTLKVDKADFTANHRGILTSFVHYATITSNRFEVLEYSSQITPGVAYGIYLNGSTGYQVEANEFSYFTGFPNYSNPDGTYGIVVNNSGPYSNRIYRNTFHQIYIGIQAQRVNCHTQTTSPDDPPNDFGLQFRCNVFDHHDIDLYDIVVPNGCTDYHQGTGMTGCNTCPANNRFSHDFSENVIDYYMDAQVPSINYVHPCNSTGCTTMYPDYEPYGTPNVFSTDAHTDPDCPSTLPSNPYSQRTALESNLEQVAELRSGIDGGSTEELLAAISNLGPDELGTVLMAAAPYLSDEALIAFLQRNDISADLIRQVLLACSPLRPAVLDAFNNMSSGLPDAVVSDILDAQGGIPPLTQLLDRISMLQAERDLAMDALVRYFLTDSTFDGGLDSIQALFRDYGTDTKAKCRLAATQVTARQFTAAQATLNEIKKDLGGNLDNDCRLLEILIRLEGAANGYYSLKDSAYHGDSVAVNAIANTPEEGSIGAQGLLKAIFGLEFPEEVDPIPSPSPNKSLSAKTAKQPVQEEGHIYPNPNNGSMMFRYNLPAGSEGQLLIYNISGQQVGSFPLKNGQSALQVDTGLGNGIYFYQFTVNKTTVGYGKFVVVK